MLRSESECHSARMSENYKWWLNLIWHRMLYSCTHMATVGVKGLTSWLYDFTRQQATILGRQHHVLLNLFQLSCKNYVRISTKTPAILSDYSYKYITTFVCFTRPTWSWNYADRFTQLLVTKFKEKCIEQDKKVQKTEDKLKRHLINVWCSVEKASSITQPMSGPNVPACEFTPKDELFSI